MDVLVIGRPDDFEDDLEQTLADLGAEWRFNVVNDATAALLLVQKQPPDVIVCDLHPIGMDGIALLERIRGHTAKSARLMLIDESEGNQAARALNVAHRLLHKPLRAEELLGAVENFCDLRDLLNSDELKAAIGRVEKLPPPPKLYLQITRALGDPDTSLADLSKLVGQDPAMAAKVLRICNSALFSGGRTISDVRSAVIRLGQLELRRLVLASEAFSGTLPAGIDREALRQRSLVASALAAKMIGGSSADMAATAGLLAEVGMLLPGVRGLDAQGELIGSGPHYAEAGAYLLGLWGLPMPIVEAVAHHHQPQRTKSRGFWLGGAVHVARALAAGHPVDEDFLRAVGVADRLPAWRAAALELGALQRETHAAAAAARSSDPLAPAREMLSTCPLEELNIDGVHIALLGLPLTRPDSHELVEAALALSHYDAIALRTGETDGSALPEQTPSALRALRLVFTRKASPSLAEFALRHFQRGVAWRPGAETATAFAEAARRRRVASWPLEDRPDLTLNELAEGCGLRQRLRMFRMLRRLRHQGEDALNHEFERLEQEDLFTVALDAVDAPREVVRRVVIHQHRRLADALRERIKLSGGKRILVVVERGSIGGLKRALRDRLPRIEDEATDTGCDQI